MASDLNELLTKLERLQKKQDDFSNEIRLLRAEILQLKEQEAQENQTLAESGFLFEEESPLTHEESENTGSQGFSEDYQAPIFENLKTSEEAQKDKSNLERFIGENLINKVGIIITIIGVAIGANYSIEHNLISPVTRIILGYLAGLTLFGFGVKLKENYTNYSAVLVSGAMAILYLVTYSAYSLFGLIPQWLAFLLMVLFTVFTTLSALKYNRQVIALIGMVGAYAVPFLLSEGSGKVHILFTYMAIINIGILAVSLKRNWQTLNKASFFITWLIYTFWYVADYDGEKHFTIAFVFLFLFFAIFYLKVLLYKLIQSEKVVAADGIVLLANSFIFYGLGYFLLEQNATGEHYLGAFTLANALTHALVSALIYKKKLAANTLYFLVSGLALVFFTMAISVQFDGTWVTLLWAGQASLLFWIGRTKAVAFYEKISYPLMILAFSSLVHDWFNASTYQDPITPLLNRVFLSSMIFVGIFSFALWTQSRSQYKSAFSLYPSFNTSISYLIPTILLASTYFAFRAEIVGYWVQEYHKLRVLADNPSSALQNEFWLSDIYPSLLSNIRDFRSIWIICYSLLFVSILSFLNTLKLKSRPFALVILVLSVFSIATYLVQGLYAISELRESYLFQKASAYSETNSFLLGIRYVSFLFIGIGIFSLNRLFRSGLLEKDYSKWYDGIFHITLLWIASSELLHWSNMANSHQSYKLGLSILWGIYSLGLIAFGIWKHKKYLRLGAIALFAITLIKLAFYDLSHLNTISKTIVFVSLGVLLLIISFLYTKYKHIIADEPS